MKYNNLYNITLQQIQIFIKCYEYRNFSKVAEELNFTPSMVSKTIKHLEDILEIKLFNRQYHSVIPTPAAQELAYGWKDVLENTMDTVFRACDVQEEGRASVKIGMLNTTRFCSEYVSFKLENPAVKDIIQNIQWERDDMHELTLDLKDNRVDMIITSSLEIDFFNPSQIEWKKIFSTPDALFVPRDHPLLRKPFTSFADCKPYPFIILSPSSYPHYYRDFISVCRKFGFLPKISSVVGNTDSARYNLTLGKGLYVAPSLICSDWENEDIKKIEYEGANITDLIVAWKKIYTTAEMKKIVTLITH